MASIKQTVARQNVRRMAVEIDDPRLPQRFWDKVQVDSSTVTVVAGKEYTGCWMWQAALNHDGYGIFGSPPGNSPCAHLYCYQALVGWVPQGLELDHLCRRRACVYPAHTEPVTHKVNMERGEEAARQFCPKGHEYTDENTDRRVTDADKGYWGRWCRACAKISQAEREADPEYREKNRQSCRDRFLNLTPEQHKAEKARMRAYHAANRDTLNKRVSDMTTEQHEAKNKAARKSRAVHRDENNARQNTKRHNLTSEQRDRINAKKRVGNMTPEQHKAANAKARNWLAANRDKVNAQKRARYDALNEKKAA